VGGEAGFDGLLVAVAEVSDAAEYDSIVEGEELEAYEAGQRQASVFMVHQVTVTGPGMMPSGRNHCQKGVAS
jgi:hypothetical protein